MDEKIVSELVRHQERQGDALEKMSASMASIANDLWSVVAGQMKVALVYPWASEPNVFRAVLVRSAEEERRLEQLLPTFEKAPPGTTMEAWLAAEHFKPIDVRQLRIGKHDGMFKAKPGAQAAPRAFGEGLELKLELESQTETPPASEPALERQSPPAA